MATSLVTPLVNGTTLLEYQVLRVLGQGGFGTTYLCEDRNLQKRVAVKEFTPHHLVYRAAGGILKGRSVGLALAFAAQKSSFLAEARSLAKFKHPNIVSVVRFFQDNNTGYFVMEHEQGSSMRGLLQNQRGVLTETELLAILVPLCEGLASLHDAGLIHRDVKPDNIIIRLDGSPVLIDFGAAVEFKKRFADDELEVIATPHYAPPEQFDPLGEQGPWTDIYALGATMYEAITGHTPPSSLQRLEHDTLVPAEALGFPAPYSSRLLGLTGKCLALRHVERPRGVGELLALLRSDEDEQLRNIIGDVSHKLTQHFTTWAHPNPDLDIDEFAAFAVSFPLIDLSWRLGAGIPTKDFFLRLYNLASIHSDELNACVRALEERGFASRKREPTFNLLLGRLDDYAAAYHLDRQAANWTYEMTVKQLIRNCLARASEVDRTGFAGLMEDVIDRARGRVKKGFRKAHQNETWRAGEDGSGVKSVGPVE